ncbi:hypothetical protein SAMN04488556_1763 [Halostagnicola kamekurae]|uniref:Uncharacterized protein n=2 Tax=Halostagnicola kamekurae TaxID=619731 RepID=A0A1I6RGF3_9EURY|nr:hypothetical protein SAMN04488556_1763 [Halostagnicola kamekurae]
MDDMELLSDRMDVDMLEQLSLKSLPNSLSMYDSSIPLTELNLEFRPMSPACELGREIGETIHHVMSGRDDQQMREIVSQMSFGFILGAYILPLPVAEVDKHGVDQFIGEINEMSLTFASKFDEERMTFDEFTEGMDEYSQKWREIERDIDQNIRHTLFEAGYLYDDDQHLFPDPTPDGILFSLDDTDYSTKWEEYRNSRSHKIIKKTRDYLIADGVDSDIIDMSVGYSTIPGSGGNVAAFQDTHDLDQLDVDVFASKENILEVYSKYRIRKRIQLSSRLAEDTSRLRDHRWRGVNAFQVFKLINTEGPNISSHEIAEIIGSRKHRDPQVTAIGRALSGEHYDSQTNWKELPLLSGNKRSWRLTDYGEVLAQYIFRDLPMFNKLSQIPKELVNQGIDSLEEITPSR